MKVISVPVRLRLATALLLLCVPIAAIEIVLATRSPWWRLPYPTLAIWCGAVFLICVPLSYGLLNGKRWAFCLTVAFAAAWCLASGWIALKLKMPSLGFFTIFLVWFFGGLLVWLKHEIGRSYFDPQLSWYQGLPKPIPGLRCRILDSEFNVSRLDKEGAFIFRQTALNEDRIAPHFGKSDLLFKFRDREVRCRAVPMRVLKRGEGAGFQFLDLPPDTRKELGDFVESLRGEGYV